MIPATCQRYSSKVGETKSIFFAKRVSLLKIEGKENNKVATLEQVDHLLIVVSLQRMKGKQKASESITCEVIARRYQH